MANSVIVQVQVADRGERGEGRAQGRDADLTQPVAEEVAGPQGRQDREWRL
jgi:hypothetical protein